MSNIAPHSSLPTSSGADARVATSASMLAFVLDDEHLCHRARV
jgi:hypothetical protein